MLNGAITVDGVPVRLDVEYPRRTTSMHSVSTM